VRQRKNFNTHAAAIWVHPAAGVLARHDAMAHLMRHMAEFLKRAGS